MSLTTTIKTLCVTALAAGVVVGIAGCGGEEPPDEPARDQPPAPREQPAQPVPPEQEPQEDNAEESPSYDPGG